MRTVDAARRRRTRTGTEEKRVCSGSERHVHTVYFCLFISHVAKMKYMCQIFASQFESQKFSFFTDIFPIVVCLITLPPKYTRSNTQGEAMAAIDAARHVLLSLPDADAGAELQAGVPAKRWRWYSLAQVKWGV